MENSRGRDAILIVTVIFNQKLRDTNVYKSLLNRRKAYKVFIYDNSPSDINSHIGALPSGWVYTHDPSNPGLSTAYNKAARYAAANNIPWLLITDQDTIFPASALDHYRMYFEHNEEYCMFVPAVMTSTGMFLSPVRTHGYNARLSHSAPRRKIKLKDYAVINSGILVATDSFLSCGGYNEKVFLDFSDFQFIERFAAKYHTAYVMDFDILQDFSNISDPPQKKLARFSLFCRSLDGYRSLRRFGRLQLRLVMLKRALSLCLSLRSPRPLQILIHH